MRIVQTHNGIPQSFKLQVYMYIYHEPVYVVVYNKNCLYYVHAC